MLILIDNWYAEKFTWQFADAKIYIEYIRVSGVGCWFSLQGGRPLALHQSRNLQILIATIFLVS